MGIISAEIQLSNPRNRAPGKPEYCDVDCEGNRRNAISLRIFPFALSLSEAIPMQADALHLIEKLNLPFPWETNARGQIIMTPVNYGHSSHVGSLIQLFDKIAPNWKAGSELGIVTSDGVKAPDVTLASQTYHHRHINDKGYVTEAPEICIEVMSPSNSWQEMQDKMPLYFEIGAQEVWIVDVDGKITFFAPGNEQLPQSRLIPEAPQSI